MHVMALSDVKNNHVAGLSIDPKQTHKTHPFNPIMEEDQPMPEAEFSIWVL
jgi:hypothetical protein